MRAALHGRECQSQWQWVPWPWRPRSKAVVALAVGSFSKAAIPRPWEPRLLKPWPHKATRMPMNAEKQWSDQVHANGRAPRAVDGTAVSGAFGRQLLMEIVDSLVSVRSRAQAFSGTLVAHRIALS